MSMRDPSDHWPLRSPFSRRYCMRGAGFPQWPCDHPSATATKLMNVSFAQIPHFRQASRSFQAIVIAVTLLALSACATLPPPTSELSAAQAAVTRAGAADADQYASSEIASARDALRRAQAAMSGGDYELARALALAAAATADLAQARSRSAQVDSAYAQQLAELATLRQRVDIAETARIEPLPLHPPEVADDATAGALILRLDALDADPQLQGLAAYERLRARQILDVAMVARSNDHANENANALALARLRVQIAAIAARTEAVGQRIDALERVRGQLLVEASRQEAERARRETERLRIQARIQAEEATRLRQAAQADSAALEVAEGVIQDVAGTQAAKLKAARAREAELARQEAELLRSLEQEPADAQTPAVDDGDGTPR